MEKSNIVITLEGGKILHLPQGATGLDIVQQLAPTHAQALLGLEVNGVLWNANRPILRDSEIKLCFWKDESGKAIFWHTTAHLLGEALEALYSGVQLGIGPAIAQGFYYDVDFGTHAFDGTHLEAIAAKMEELAKKKSHFERIPLSKKEAVAHYTTHYNPYKLELIEGLNDGDITLYKQGNFIDLCRGGHLPHTGYIKALKLTSVAAAYWRGDVKNKQLTRIYGISFPDKKALRKHLDLVEEAKKRDHRKLGKALGIFTFSQKVGLGLPLWLPKGTRIREGLVNFLQQEQEKQGYQNVITPHIGHKDLYMTSGHYQKYQESTFRPITTPHEGEEFLLKPMNCPHHCEIYKSSMRTYRDLPLRFAEQGTVYRYEQHGELHGLTRTRGFTQDDAHIFCTQAQVQEEFCKVIELVLKVLKVFDFKDYEAHLSFRDPDNPAKYMGRKEDWDAAEAGIQAAVATTSLKAKVVAEAAFYGPKLDFMVQDALGRKWQLGTVQLDYQLPERFELTYVGEDNKKHRPVMIHRAPFGSLERFIALLIEHTGGRLPLWLAPEQVAILPVASKYLPYARKVADALTAHNLRTHLDARDEKLGRKVRDAEVVKIPYMLIVGEQEVTQEVVTVRQHGERECKVLALEACIAMLRARVAALK